jgi:F0F1-type ATP synthase assembly protein I
MLMRTMRPLTAVQQQGVGWVSERGGGDEQTSRQRGPTGTELIGLGLLVAASVLLPMLAGLGVDVLLHISPAGLLLGLVVGVTIATVSVYRQYKRYM